MTYDSSSYRSLKVACCTVQITQGAVSSCSEVPMADQNVAARIDSHRLRPCFGQAVAGVPEPPNGALTLP